MSFLKKLFGLGGDDAAPGEPKILSEETHEGYLIKAKEMKVGSEYQLAGTIEKEINGELKTSTFIRADRLASAEMVSSAAINKAKQIIKEQGDRLFD
ncbi:HlyU family transcriptional regulator [Maritalea sp.]|uniref:HlyU family transcriptional regulator n=1 Tax=Maritalea sp. TaxID=2003361 RepID=UPI003EF634D9